MDAELFDRGNGIEENMSYDELLRHLSREWILLELHHRTSKAASQDFWDLAKKCFPRLYKKRIDDMVYKPIPKFRSQRKRVYKDDVPEVTMEIAYRNKDTKELTVVQADKTPTTFNPKNFEKIFEVATVKVIKLNL